MSNSVRVKAWRKRTRERIVQSLGGKCVCCGYHRLSRALDVHHLDPTVKDFNLGAVRANIISWDRTAAELKKCVLLCVRCHLEVHEGVTQVPDDATRFKETPSRFERSAEGLYDRCPVCGDQKSVKLLTCSRKCSALKARKVDWSRLDELLLTKTRSQIADELGVSWTAVNKRIKRNISCGVPER